MAISVGTRLGPYEILEPLGAGGMGEVYRARDPRLSREVAVKLIATDGTPSPDRLRRFETEARAAAQLSHPNVVTVHDVGTHEGHPYLVLELLEGETLREALRGGVPPLRQAVVWALEVSRGLAAAHERGIVHRDLKPENVFLTTDGRVKILDFGLAKLREPLVSDEADRESPTATKDTSPGVLLGTVGYMSPEQVKGQTPDPRTDVFALGTVLFEMVTGRRAFGGEAAPEVLAAILRDEPPPLESILPGVPATLETVVRRCLAKRPSDRFSSGGALEVALETVLPSLEPSRAPGGRPLEARGPYPGLSSFTEADAERFFGREAEVEALWGKLRRGRLLAVIGPSGAGKTSFVRAGLVSSRPSGWGAVVATPGSAPMRALAQALVEVLPSDSATMKELLAFDDPDVAISMVRRWRDSHLEGLLVVDQFEELFTLNPPEVQARFAEFLGRLAKEADVRVLLSLRDDFLMRCHEQEVLTKVFEHLTPLGPLSADGLRRALTEPAKREGFAFEDDALVEEMLEAVEGARGALPLLAFAVSRLWEKRDREKKLLTRKAYEEIGGVAGALAQHAEQTLERIGLDKEPVVRELFRNLVTAQWTRAVADRDQLLSALPDPEVGAQVLDHLIDARLLTSYEVREGDDAGTSRHRIEIVHESLLRAWPRLVRWQAQDEEGAVLRDQLKQAAHLWEEKGRPDDLLWTGTSEREFELWQDRYPGKLTALEDDFARAMVHRAQRRKQLRRTATAAVVAGLSLVAAAIAVSRHQEAEARRLAEAEARRAEAARLVALGRLELDRYPTAALAYARKSLELADTAEARRFAVEVLWRGPTARILPVARIARELGTGEERDFIQRIALSPDGSWLATRESASQAVHLFPSDGGPARALPATPTSSVNVLAFGPQGDLLVRGGPENTLQFWSLPDLSHVRTAALGGQFSWGKVRRDTLFTFTQMSEGSAVDNLLRAWPLPASEPQVLGRWPTWLLDVDASGESLVMGRGQLLRRRGLDGGTPPRERVVARYGDDLRNYGFVGSDRLATVSRAGDIHLWSLTTAAPTLLGVLKGGQPQPTLYGSDPEGHFLAVGGEHSSAILWDLDRPSYVLPHVLVRPDMQSQENGRFDSTGRWLVATNGSDVAFWPMVGPRVNVLRGPLESSGIWSMAFTSDGRYLVTPSMAHETRLWPLGPGDGEDQTLLPGRNAYWVHADATEARVLLATYEITIVPIDGDPPTTVETPFGIQAGIAGSVAAFDPERPRIVAAPFDFRGFDEADERALGVYDLESGAWQLFSLAHLTQPGWNGFEWIRVAPDGTVFGSGFGGVRRLVLPEDPEGTVTGELLYDTGPGRAHFDLSGDGRLLLTWGTRDAGELDRFDELVLFDLAEGTSRRLTTHGRSPFFGALDPAGRTIVSGGSDGLVRAGPVSGEEPHLLYGHTGPVMALAVSPDGRFIASASDDSIRLWPMPDVNEPPFHTLPYEELMAKLQALTNLEVVEDETESSGYRVEVGPFPGWEDAPDW